MPPRYQSTLLTFEEKARNLFDHFGQPAHRGHARVDGGPGLGGLGQQSLIQNPAAGSIAAKGQLLVLSATADSIASAGDYITFGAEVYRHAFEDYFVDAQTIRWPLAFAGGSIQIELAWDTYTGGGTVEIEVNGAVPAWGLVAASNAGRTGSKRRSVHLEAGDLVKIKITQTSGSAQTLDALVEFVAPDPASTSPRRYRDVVLGDAPLAYWRLGEMTGTTAIDETGNGHDATYVGGFTLAQPGVMNDGLGDPAVDLSGSTGSGVTGSDWADLEFAGVVPFSVECWFAADSLASGSRILVQKQVTSSGPGWEFIVVGGATPYLSMRTEGWSVDSDAGSIEVGSRLHAVATYDGDSTARLYINGSQAEVLTVPPTALPSTAATLSIGHDSESSGFAPFDGRIDEVALYDRELTATEVQEHFLVGTSG